MGRATVFILRLLCTMVYLSGVACSDQSSPPPGDVGHRDGMVVEGGAADTVKPRPEFPWDGFDVKCPMGPPCVYQVKGEGKHAGVVIGERMTLIGKGLDGVDTVYLGAVEARIISVSATEVVCRVAPRTPAGTFSVEVKAGSSRRKYNGTTVWRLVLAAADDDTRVQSFDATTHSAGQAVTLPEPPALPPRITMTGRFLVARGKQKLFVADLAREEVTEVNGLATEIITSWTTIAEDKQLIVTSASGKLYTVDLSAFPTLVGVSISGASATVSTVASSSVTGPLMGLHPTVAANEGSLWFASTELKSFTWVQKATKPFLVGDGADLKPLDAVAGGAAAAFLVQDGATPTLALLSVDGSGIVTGEGAISVPGASQVAMTEDGAYAAMGADRSTPELIYAPIISTQLETLPLGTGTGSRMIPVRLPTRPSLVAVVVGAKPAGDLFIGSKLEIADLAADARLLAGGKPAIEVADLRAAVGDPIYDQLHLVTGSEFLTYSFTVTGKTVTTTAKQPNMLLTAGKRYRWIAIQP